MPAEQLAELFTLIEGGAEVAAENIVSFPTDVMAAGAQAATGVTETVTLGNGAAAEVSQLAVIEGGAATGTTTGVGLLAMDVGVAGAAIAPALGLIAGVGLYNLAPEFWTNVSNALVEAGETVGGKVRAYLDSATKQVCLSEQTIEIFKNAFLNAGLFTTTTEFDYESDHTYDCSGSFLNTFATTEYDVQVMYNAIHSNWPSVATMADAQLLINHALNYAYNNLSVQSNRVWHLYLYAGQLTIRTWQSYDLSTYNKFRIESTSYGKYFKLSPTPPSGRYDTVYVANYGTNYSSGSTKVGNFYVQPFFKSDNTADGSIGFYTNSTCFPAFAIANNLPIGGRNTLLIMNLGKLIPSEYMQPNSTPPSTNPFPQTYTNWNPITIGNINVYPMEVPATNPNPTQQEAQNPDPDPPADNFLEWLLDNLPQPDPIPNPSPQPVPIPDPDPQPEPEPIPDPGTDPVDPDPPDPNPPIPPGPIPIVPDLPATVNSNAMFTVYRPSLSQLNSFGGWLWTSSIIEQLVRMWSNPLEGIIVLMKVYASPTVGSSQNIIVGYLDSGVSAPVVTSQFVTIDCGTVNVSEQHNNATDYTPYVSLHLYLPFIGIVELDTDEFMSGSINVKYHVDVYTGTCLAEVRATRSPDMPNATIIYTFSGNASQQLPVTSSNFAGALSTLVSAVGGGIAIASGGGVAGIAGGLAIGHSLTHEMVHVGHSGALSANAGIMGARKPYLIISRRHSYDANAYNELYGFPANKTVMLGNCSGFTRVKACRLKTKASENEKEEIKSLLQKGVIL